MTFDATVNPVTYEGGELVFIDTEYDTWNMDPEALEGGASTWLLLDGIESTERRNSQKEQVLQSQRSVTGARDIQILLQRKS